MAYNISDVQARGKPGITDPLKDSDFIFHKSN